MSTETITCLVHTSMLKAALLFAAKEDTRTYLCSVCVQIGPEGARMIATDGHRLFLGLISAEEKRETVHSFAISRGVIESALKLNKKQPVIPVSWERDETPSISHPGAIELSKARVVLGGINTGDVEEEFGRFPDWTRVIPDTVSGETAQFNPYYLADCSEAAELLTGKSRYFLHVEHNGQGPAVVPLTDDAFAVVMPCRTDDEGFALPAWFKSEAYALPDWFTPVATPAKKRKPRKAAAVATPAPSVAQAA